MEDAPAPSPHQFVIDILVASGRLAREGDKIAFADACDRALAGDMLAAERVIGSLREIDRRFAQAMQEDPSSGSLSDLRSQIALSVMGEFDAVAPSP